ncbi:DUF2294 domain-containing protein [Mesobacillus maritimus]|uniref:Na-translocating system protein MpsC family protein n=1 Tax=Mesobacillus maritimus TaxID=1643336 RepID=UPI00203EAC7E|nr:Na-translocating system protein MpsC family protein [Mesobacillus maritimus]MCM3585455.1 DUF2294 domain-containing protein [Mesobacillus maritimus]
MGSTIQDGMLYLSSKFSKTLKSRFGKGPETCYVTFVENKLFIYINHFMTPAEEVLVENHQGELANRFRRSVMDVICKEFIHDASNLVNVELQYALHDWNYDTNKGIVIMESAGVSSKEFGYSSFENKLSKLFAQIASRVHKVPDEMKIVKINQNVCVFECTGVMLSLDRYLYENGQTNLLHDHTHELKKALSEYKPHFEAIFTRELEDFFIIWEYEKDKSYVIFNFL